MSQARSNTSSDPMLEIRDLVKTFRSEHGKGHRVNAVDGVSLKVEHGEMFTLLGPSGCGKTTTLRCIAGLERPDSGRLVVDGRVLFSSADRINVPAYLRGLGMVFQSYAIWPHMNVVENVAFPLVSQRRRHRPSRKTIEERVQRALDMVELGKLGVRPATNLSGGQQQRLALARALVAEAPLLLLDEPLSNLDARLRESMRFELRHLQRRFGITTVYVTHDQSEALGMSSRIAVMNGGKVEQVGTPQEIYNNPKTQFVANFIGTANFLEGTIEARDPERGYLVNVGLGSIWGQSLQTLEIGRSVTVSVRPEWVRIAEYSEPTSLGQPNVLRGTVITPEFQGEAMDYLLRLGDREIRARTPPSIEFPHGTHVSIEFDRDHSRILSMDD